MARSFRGTFLRLGGLGALILTLPQFRADPPTGTTGDEIGRSLAETHCVACHLFPEPELLTKRSWKYALTYMGYFLGISDERLLEGESEFAWESIRLRKSLLADAGLLSSSAVMGESDWNELTRYYMESAPETSLPQDPKPLVMEDAKQFAVAPNQYRMDAAITSLTSIDESHGWLLLHDSRAERLTLLDRRLNFFDEHPSPGVSLVKAVPQGDELYLLSIGDLFASNMGGRLGELQRVRILGSVFLGLEIPIKGLHRPADFVFADVDSDGNQDVLISEFGDYTGALSLFWGRGQDFEEKPQSVSEQPGIVKSVAHDFDGDGDLDIIAMASAARENVSLFINEGNRAFRRVELWQKHPSFGYIGFELRDFNSDGQLDLLTLNGDNGDSDPYNTLKRDQGIRIYLNRGDFVFEEVYFYPLYGVYGAEVEDFDEDGDLDIAAISFHPDFDLEQPENFVILWQSQSMEFSPTTHPASREGRWLTMDAGDIDGDGDKDIVLGAAYTPVGMRDHHMDRFQQLAEKGPPILVLKNQAKK